MNSFKKIFLIYSLQLLIPGFSRVLAEFLEASNKNILSSLINISLILIVLCYALYQSYDIKRLRINRKLILINISIGTIVGLFLLLPMWTSLYFYNGKELLIKLFNTTTYAFFGVQSFNYIFWLIFFCFFFMSSILEELVFRKGFQNHFNSKLGVFGSIIFTSFLFSVSHFFYGLVSVKFFIINLILSGVFGLLYLTTNSIVSSVVAHLVYNSRTFFWAPLIFYLK